MDQLIHSFILCVSEGQWTGPKQFCFALTEKAKNGKDNVIFALSICPYLTLKRKKENRIKSKHQDQNLL
jgi:hypothetical protein